MTTIVIRAFDFRHELQQGDSVEFVAPAARDGGVGVVIPRRQRLSLYRPDSTSPLRVENVVPGRLLVQFFDSGLPITRRFEVVVPDQEEITLRELLAGRYDYEEPVVSRVAALVEQAKRLVDNAAATPPPAPAVPSDLVEQVEEHSSRLIAYERGLREVQEEYGPLTERVGAMRRELNGKADNTTVDDLVARIDSLVARVEELESQPKQDPPVEDPPAAAPEKDPWADYGPWEEPEPETSSRSYSFASVPDTNPLAKLSDLAATKIELVPVIEYVRAKAKSLPEDKRNDLYLAEPVSKITGRTVIRDVWDGFPNKVGIVSASGAIAGDAKAKIDEIYSEIEGAA
ncbi:hypothetical protein CPHO_07025 [Corynebacterium phocae]|uniref:Uncharacterized protein n=1 Tax=Corynebacterium phocae TaxID=161895 RepID=A0A1L7D3E2_9CORY|nr:hypothetical protein [Corynebacterium phocae]APT92686.1 hypothetical protein CPHO_07025 [Corynebacterium phocae]KAA8723575.1 hypothetical protein F4V58_06535 [Corynebacterium phocae]